MLYPRIDLLQVLILEIRRVFPSASSKQRTGTVKTPHNSFQRKTTVMDCRLPWKWGTTLIEQTESVQTQAILTERERERKYTFFFSPSLFSFAPSYHIQPLQRPMNCQYSTFYPQGKFLSFLLVSYGLWRAAGMGNQVKSRPDAQPQGAAICLFLPIFFFHVHPKNLTLTGIIEHNLALIMSLELI